MDGFSVFLVVVAIAIAVWLLIRGRRKSAAALEESASASGADLSTTQELFEPTATHHAPVESFHVQGEEAIVTFDVPLGDQDDTVLFNILTDEAIEVVREKSHTLPIDGVTQVVAMAGRPQPREVGRKKLPSPGELPPPVVEGAFSFGNIAKDPFAAPFDEKTDHGVVYETRSDTPADELGPLIDEVTLPDGLARGLRASGVDPETVDAPDLLLGLLRMFGYRVTEHTSDGSFMAVKGGLTTYILTEEHAQGSHPELSEGVIQRFIAEFGMSGADRGLLLTGKFGPFAVHEIEARQPNVRFITRERLQAFIETMALG